MSLFFFSNERQIIVIAYFFLMNLYLKFFRALTEMQIFLGIPCFLSQ